MVLGAGPSGATLRPAVGRGQAFEPTRYWSAAKEVPGAGRLNAGGNAFVASLSCATAADCAAGGSYVDANSQQEAFVASEIGGTWQKAEEVPGTVSLNAGGFAGVNAVSCPVTGSCVAGGYYVDAAGHRQAFVADEVDGNWQQAETVPGTSALNASGYASVSSLACSSAGSCVAVGSYVDAKSQQQAFLAEETDGVWQDAEEVPGTAALNAGGGAGATSVACPTVGNCSAGGYFLDSTYHQQAFVVDEVKGIWQDAEEVPATAGLNTAGDAEVLALSCSTAGNCSAGGSYETRTNHFQAFVADESGGTWRDAEEVPGTAGLNLGGSAGVHSISCPAGGGCTAGGYYEDSAGRQQVWVADESGGTWRDAEELPGSSTLNSGQVADLSSVSCASPGNCAAAGSYTEGTRQQAFVADEVKGAWQRAEEVPGTAALNSKGYAAGASISCVAAGGCTAGGYYTDRAGNEEAFVASQTEAPLVTRLSPRRGAASGGTIVKLRGEDLAEAKAVYFGKKAARIARRLTRGEIEVVSPKGVGNVYVTVRSPYGLSSKEASDRFSYLPRPAVSGISPRRGPASGGTVVRITGKNFRGVTAVHFGRARGRILRLVSHRELLAVAPSGHGAVRVTVTTLGGTSRKNAAERYRYLP